MVSVKTETCHMGRILQQLIYQPQEDERLSWASYLTYSGRFTHINGYPSSALQVQARESY